MTFETTPEQLDRQLLDNANYEFRTEMWNPESDRILVTGPSGSGKTTILNHMNEHNRGNPALAVDLDEVGFRPREEDLHTWCLKYDAVDTLMSENDSQYGYGLSTNIYSLVDDVIHHGWKGVAVLLPSTSALVRNRQERASIKRPHDSDPLDTTPAFEAMATLARRLRGRIPVTEIHYGLNTPVSEISLTLFKLDFSKGLRVIDLETGADYQRGVIWA